MAGNFCGVKFSWILWFTLQFTGFIPRKLIGSKISLLAMMCYMCRKKRKAVETTPPPAKKSKEENDEQKAMKVCGNCFHCCIMKFYG